MSEKIYAILLRLYPSSFRERYAQEALQLFRDRARQEAGVFRQLRFWADILADFAVSVPRAYRDAKPALAAAALRQTPDGMPSFDLLKSEPLRPAALVFGAFLSLAVMSASFIMIRHAGDDLPSVARAQHQSPPAERPDDRNFAADKTANTRGDSNASGTMSAASVRAKSGVAAKSADSQSGDLQPEAQSLQDYLAASESQASRITTGGAATSGIPADPEPRLDAAEKQRVIDAAIANLKAHYFDPQIAQKTADALRASENRGEVKAIADGAAFAALLTQQMRDASQDMHLIVEYSTAKLPDHPMEITADDAARYRKMLLENNCFFRDAEILPHNIGYLKVDWFADPSVCRQRAAAAMASVNHADALIFDLRDNHGGDPSMVKFLGSYLFKRPASWFSPRGGTPAESMTDSPVRGSRLADKPVYILTSSATWSGAEQFSYDLKMLKRATLVGETTRGGAHAGVFHRIDDHFGIGIPEVKVTNPFSNADWEGVGVSPDLKVKASDALSAAEKLAEVKLLKK
jgi:hypothetical protein